MDPITILSAFAPLLVDAGKAMVNKWLGQRDFKPASVEEFIKIKDKELEHFRLINEAGGHNQSYPWVEAIVRLMRPSIAAVVILVWGYSHVEQFADTEAIDNAAAVIAFYLFGERSLFYARKKDNS